MRNIATLSIVALTLNGWAAGAWAQSAATSRAVPKPEGLTNAQVSNVEYRQSLAAGSMKPADLANDFKAASANGAVDSSPRPLPENERRAAQTQTLHDAFKTAGLQQAMTPVQAGASVSGAKNTLSVKPEPNQH
jgi:hypothetical protein